MTIGKVKTLFTDKEKTEALFPRTKLSAVSDENGVGLDALMEHLAYTDEKSNDIIINTIDADSLNGIPAKDWAQKSFVTSEIAKAQFSGSGEGNIDLSGFATKDDLATKQPVGDYALNSSIPTKVSELTNDSGYSTETFVNNAIKDIDYPVDSVNGKTGSVSLSAGDVGAAVGMSMITSADATTASGMYRIQGASDVPAPCDYGQLVVVHGGADTIAQIAFDYIASKMWIRTGAPAVVGGGSVWGSWRRVVAEDSFSYSNGILSINI